MALQSACASSKEERILPLLTPNGRARHEHAKRIDSIPLHYAEMPGEELDERIAAARATLGERLVIRFDAGEARMLTAAGEKITLYQIPSSAGSSVRYSNGNMELRGKGMDLTLIENGAATTLEGCQQYVPPKT